MILEKHWQEISEKGVDTLKEYNILYLALEMRVGKTPTSLLIASKYGSSSVLFVTTKKSIDGIDGFDRDMKLGLDLETINYEQLHNYTGNPDLVIVDEAHKCGAFPKPSERTVLLKKICEGKPIIYLSGTPTPESFSQIYHQLWISSFSPFAAYKNFYAWANDHVRIQKKRYNGQAFNDYSKADQEKVEQAISHLFLNYTQAEAGFEQKIDEEVLLVKMLPVTYAFADKLIKNRIYTGRSGQVVLADTAVKLQSKLHQIFSGTVITEDGNQTSIIFDKSKVSMIADVFRDKKIAVFYKFKAEEVMLRAHIGRPVTTDPAVFNESTGIVFISQILSGREGINLDTAEALIFLNIDFSATSYIQARARLTSKARTMPAKVYWIFSDKGIEQKIYKAVTNKMDYTLSYFRKDYGIKNSGPNISPPGNSGLADGQDNDMHETRMAGFAGAS